VSPRANIRPYRPEDLEAVVACFGRSVRTIGARWYSPEQIEAWARERGARSFEADVSLAARSLFERAGFRVDGEQQVRIRGIELLNFRMSMTSEPRK